MSKRQKKQMNKKTKDIIFYTLLLAFPMLQFAVFYIGVNFNSLLLSFRTFEPIEGVYKWAGFSNFKRFFVEFKTRSLFKQALNNSLLAFVLGLIFGTIVGLIFSYYIYKRFFGHKFFKVILFVPSIISSIVIITIFMQFVEVGIPGILKELFDYNMLGFLANHKTTFYTIVFYNIWIGFGVTTILYVSAMDSISPSMIEAAKMDGVNNIQEFFYIIMPSIWPTFSQFLIISVGGIFITQLNLYGFYGHAAETRLYTFGYYLYREVVGATNAELPYLATIGIVLTFITIPLTIIIRKLITWLGPTVE